MLIGEKQSLVEVLDPLAESYEAELILPTGELSTTLLYGIMETRCRRRQAGSHLLLFRLRSDRIPHAY